MDSLSAKMQSMEITNTGGQELAKHRAFYITENAASQENNLQQLWDRSTVSASTKPADGTPGTPANTEPMPLTRQKAFYIPTNNNSNVHQELVRQNAFYIPGPQTSSLPQELVRQDAFYLPRN